MHALFERMRTAYVESRCLVRRVARFLFADDQQDYTPVRATLRLPPRSLMLRGLYSNDGRDERPRKRARPSPEELRREAYVARLWADDTKDFKIE